MIWKVIALLALGVSVLGDDHHHHYAYSEQNVELRNVQRGHHGELGHIGYKSEHHQEYAHAYPSYEFSYKVSDPHTHDFKGQHEIRDGDVVKGEYWLVQPDGVKRTVKYHADKHSGFKAQVHYDGPHKHIVEHHPRHIEHHEKAENYEVENRNGKKENEYNENEKHEDEKYEHEKHEHEKHEHEKHEHEKHENEKHEHEKHEHEKNEHDKREREIIERLMYRERENKYRESEGARYMKEHHKHKIVKHKPIINHVVSIFGERKSEHEGEHKDREQMEKIPIFDFERIQPKIEHKEHHMHKEHKEDHHKKYSGYHREIYHPYWVQKEKEYEMARKEERAEPEKRMEEENVEGHGDYNKHNEPYYGHKRHYYQH